MQGLQSASNGDRQRGIREVALTCSSQHTPKRCHLRGVRLPSRGLPATAYLVLSLFLMAPRVLPEDAQGRTQKLSVSLTNQQPGRSRESIGAPCLRPGLMLSAHLKALHRKACERAFPVEGVTLRAGTRRIHVLTAPMHACTYTHTYNIDRSESLDLNISLKDPKKEERNTGRTNG